jgi:hypothetical protein
LRVGWARSWSDWSLVYAWTVVMRARSIPKRSSRTLAKGARQFVVHDAFEITCCAAGSKTWSLTPRQMVASASPLGAEIMTRRAPPLR